MSDEPESKLLPSKRFFIFYFTTCLRLVPSESDSIRKLPSYIFFKSPKVTFRFDFKMPFRTPFSFVFLFTGFYSVVLMLMILSKFNMIDGFGSELFSLSNYCSSDNYFSSWNSFSWISSNVLGICFLEPYCD